MSTKINQLLQALPPGGVATQPWLKAHGIDARLADKYVRSGWLMRIGHGAFSRTGQTVDWPGALASLQQQWPRPVYPGGPTALELRGYAHHLSLRSQTALTLFGPPQSKLPGWFRNGSWSRAIQYCTPRLFREDPHPPKEAKVEEIIVMGHPVKIPPLERAALELMWLVPKRFAFDEALHLFETLTVLRPALVQYYLEVCQSVQAKRLLLYSAERINFTWIKQLDLTSVDLGSGPRTIHPGGRLNKTYNLVIHEQQAY